MGNIKLIKKYGNRKLYDTQTSQYTTLGDIFKLITGGENFQVVSNKSSEDITNDTILSALSEYYRLNKSTDLVGLLGTVETFIKTNGLVVPTVLPTSNAPTLGGLNE